MTTPADTPTREDGFTLVELLVAIVIAAGVAATARGVVATIGDAGLRLASASAAEDSIAGGELLSRWIIRQTRRLPGDSLGLFGTDRGFVIQSWCPVAGGWAEPCEVTFAVDASTASLVGVAPDPVCSSHGPSAVAVSRAVSGSRESR